MVYPEDNTGIAGLSFDDSDLLQSNTSLHAKRLRETCLKYGKMFCVYEIKIRVKERI